VSKVSVSQIKLLSTLTNSLIYFKGLVSSNLMLLSLGNDTGKFVSASSFSPRYLIGIGTPQYHYQLTHQSCILYSTFWNPILSSCIFLIASFASSPEYFEELTKMSF